MIDFLIYTALVWSGMTVAVWVFMIFVHRVIWKHWRLNPFMCEDGILGGRWR